MTRRIYLASSWRNANQPSVVRSLRADGHSVYDFRAPESVASFKWGEIDPEWKAWTAKTYREQLLTSEKAARGFTADFRAMLWCDVCVLLLPCGRSAHLELGYCAGMGKYTIIYLCNGEEPELMNLLANELVTSYDELVERLT